MPSSTSVTLSAHAHVAPAKPLKCAYITFLLTSPSYLPGILTLAHTLRHPTTSPSGTGSAYPLIVAVNPALPAECIKALEDAGVEVRVVEPLVPVGPVTIIAERFVDTWTKLRVWEFEEFDHATRRNMNRTNALPPKEAHLEGLILTAAFRYQLESTASGIGIPISPGDKRELASTLATGSWQTRQGEGSKHEPTNRGSLPPIRPSIQTQAYTLPPSSQRLILIDGDMMIRQNMDELFHMPLPEDQIACCHACVCNLDKSSWAPDDWTRENCAYTPTTHPSALTAPTDPSPSPAPHLLLNSGLVVLTPSSTTMTRITDLLASSNPAHQSLIASWMFPDQDLIAELFRGKWEALPWCYNALKTMRYWHGGNDGFWRDEEVRNVHYICDKPWKRRPGLKSDAPPAPDPDAPANPLEEPINPRSRYTCYPGRFLETYDAELGIPAEEADAVTHGWWWDAYEQMRAQLVKNGYGSLEYLEGLVAK